MDNGFNKSHPERKDDEVFVGNANEYGFQNIGWETKRKGKQAYYSTGDMYPDKSYFPVFASASEIESENREIYNRLKP
ncbi:hypothetical protein H6776_02620 [Candidatus Nomurabacteria bacterium]|nr:hypothetical protein [Candidatus Nomurabacteria bacterium]